MGNIYGNHEIISLPDGSDHILGKGAQGITYLARHLTLENHRACKVIKHTRNDKARDMFLQEARYVARLEHPHIVMVVDCGEQKGELYAIFEYCAYGSLADYCSQNGPLAWPDALLVIKQMANALHTVHTAKSTQFPNGLLHRDIKPENIMIHSLRPLHVKLIDFGVAGVIESDAVSYTHLTLPTKRIV